MNEHISGEIMKHLSLYYNHSLCLGAALLGWEQGVVDVDWLASFRDLHGVEQLEQLGVRPDSQVDVLGLDGLHFALLSQVTSQFEDLSCDVLQHCGQEGSSS